VENVALTQDYLNPRWVRLEASEPWGRPGQGVCFLFPRAGGAGRCQQGATQQALSPGDVLVVSGQTAARIRPAHGAEFSFWGFSLRLDHLFPLFAGIEISLLQHVMEGFKGPKFYPASSLMAAECHQLLGEIPPQLDLDHRGRLLRVAATILSHEFKAAHTQRAGFVRPEDHLVQVFEKLSAEEMLGLSVDELAERFSCSRRHLNRLFHQYFGFSVAALRMEMRLIKAVSLLRDGDVKVIHVAEQCGFNHLGLFNTCFRRRFGISPGQWRKAASRQGENLAKPGENDLDCPLRTKGLCPWPGSAGSTAPRPAPPPGRTARPAGSLAPVGAGLRLTVAATQKVTQSLGFQVRTDIE